MGQCASSSGHKEENHAGKPQVNGKNTNTNDSSNPNGISASENDFRETMKSVTLVILIKLTKAMEANQAGFHQVAIKLHKQHSMQLINSVAWENFFQETFEFEQSSENQNNLKPQNKTNNETKKFLHLLQLTENSHYKPNINREAVVKSLQSTIEASQKELTAAANAADTAEIRQQLRFFIKTLEFANGDININPQLLYNNIEQITKQK